MRPRLRLREECMFPKERKKGGRIRSRGGARGVCKAVKVRKVEKEREGRKGGKRGGGRRRRRQR